MSSLAIGRCAERLHETRAPTVLALRLVRRLQCYQLRRREQQALRIMPADPRALRDWQAMKDRREAA